MHTRLWQTDTTPAHVHPPLRVEFLLGHICLGKELGIWGTGIDESGKIANRFKNTHKRVFSFFKIHFKIQICLFTFSTKMLQV
jgi:hypothetical protein